MVDAFKREMRIFFEMPKTDEEIKEVEVRRRNIQEGIGGSIGIWP